VLIETFNLCGTVHHLKFLLILGLLLLVVGFLIFLVSMALHLN
jgi:hypothetical protein